MKFKNSIPALALCAVMLVQGIFSCEDPNASFLPYEEQQEKPDTTVTPPTPPPTPPTPPDTSGTPPTPPAPASKIPVWFELPVINDADGNRIDDGDSTLYYAYHYSKNGSRNYRNYTVCFSAKHHCPLWVAAPRHKCYVGSIKRTDAYRSDPDIPAGIQYSTTSTGGSCNKGHMLGSAERTGWKELNRDVFYYSNIAPQFTNFNTGGGRWNNLEELVDSHQCSDTLYVVIGCHFDTFTDSRGKTYQSANITFGGRSDVTRPSMFYYAMIRTHAGNCGKTLKNCNSNEIECVAFVIGHSNDEKGKEPSASDMMSVSDLEKITGLTYFPNVPNAPKTTYNTNFWL